MASCMAMQTDLEGSVIACIRMLGLVEESDLLKVLLSMCSLDLFI